MDNLIVIIDGTPWVTSLVMARSVGYAHATVIKLVREHQYDLEEFGLVRFEIQARPVGQHGGADVEYAILNEQQASLILTYMRNNDVVRAFKKNLIKCFWAMRHRLASPPTPQRSPAELLLLMAQQNLEHEQRLLTVEQKVNQVENKLLTRDQYMTVLEFFQRLGMKTNKEALQQFGKSASRRSRECGCEIATKHQDDRGFRGNVNAYHPDILYGLL
jgi:phage regulator Rha-like protein